MRSFESTSANTTYAGRGKESLRNIASDMDSLKRLIAAARPGTGEVTHIIATATFCPRAAAFTSLLQLCAKSREMEKALEIFHAMQLVACIQPNTFSYSAAISACGRAGKWQQAEALFNELLHRSKHDHRCRPNTVTYSALISAYEKAGLLDHALHAFRQQLDRGVEPDLITYSSLISACERQGQLNQALDLLDAMHSQGLAGTPKLYNSLIAAAGSSGDWESALEVFLGMLCAQVDPNQQSCSALMAALVSGDQARHALLLLGECRQKGVTLGAATLSSLASMLAVQDAWRSAVAVADHMMEAGLVLEADAGEAVVKACCRARAHHHAQRLQVWTQRGQRIEKGRQGQQEERMAQEEEEEEEGEGAPLGVLHEVQPVAKLTDSGKQAETIRERVAIRSASA